jgi:hypothetical protein
MMKKPIIALSLALLLLTLPGCAILSTIAEGFMDEIPRIIAECRARDDVTSTARLKACAAEGAAQWAREAGKEALLAGLLKDLFAALVSRGHITPAEALAMPLRGASGDPGATCYGTPSLRDKERAAELVKRKGVNGKLPIDVFGRGVPSPLHALIAWGSYIGCFGDERGEFGGWTWGAVQNKLRVIIVTELPGPGDRWPHDGPIECDETEPGETPLWCEASATAFDLWKDRDPYCFEPRCFETLGAGIAMHWDWHVEREGAKWKCSKRRLHKEVIGAQLLLCSSSPFFDCQGSWTTIGRAFEEAVEKKEAR